MSEHVCVECGESAATRAELELHWEAERHSPADVQRSQLERLRASLRPAESALVQRRRGHPGYRRRT